MCEKKGRTPQVEKNRADVKKGQSLCTMKPDRKKLVAIDRGEGGGTSEI